MISRNTAAAALFALLATGSLAFAAGLESAPPAQPGLREPAPVVQLERVVVTAKRLPAESR